MVLKVLGPDIETDYDSDDDYIPARLPLLRNQSQTAQPNSTLKNDSWNVSVRKRMTSLLLDSEVLYVVSQFFCLLQIKL